MVKRYKSLDVKNILLETVSHLIFPQMLTSSLLVDINDLLKGYFRFMDDHFRESADLTFLAYRHRENRYVNINCFSRSLLLISKDGCCGACNWDSVGSFLDPEGLEPEERLKPTNRMKALSRVPPNHSCK